MNNPDSYLDKTRCYLEWMEIDWCKITKSARRGCSLQSYPAVSSNGGWTESCRTGFYSTAEQELLNRYVFEKSYLTKQIQSHVFNGKGIADLNSSP